MKKTLETEKLSRGKPIVRLLSGTALQEVTGGTDPSRGDLERFEERPPAAAPAGKATDTNI